MKYSNLLAFEKHLESAVPDHFADLYLLHAKDSFIKKQAADRLVALALPKETLPVALQTFDAERHTVEKVLLELDTINFLAKKRVILVHNVDIYDKSSLALLERHFAPANANTCLVLTASSINRSTNFYKKVEKLGVLLDIPEEKPWEKEKNAVEWLRSAIVKEKKHASPAVAQLMVRRLGTDLALLHAELLKLICYIGEKHEIEEKDLSAIGCMLDPGTIWQLGEAVFRCETVVALRILKGLLTDGSAFFGLLRQLRTQFQTELTICSILASGGSSSDVTQHYPYMKGQILERHMAQAQQYGMQKLKKGLQAIDDTEVRAKNSSGDPDLLAELLIIKLTL